MSMRFIVTASAIAAASDIAGALLALAQTAPQVPADVARPSGDTSS
jgi:hypothetical protein